MVVVVTFCFLIYWPTFRWLVNTWLSSDFYSHGFLVPLVSGFFVWTKREHLKTKYPSLVGVFLLISGLALYALSFLSEIRVLGALSFWMVLIALVFLIFGVHTARVLLFPMLFLVFMIPLPFIQDLTYRLQEISLYSSSHLLILIRLPVTVSGSEIYLSTTTFTIGLPCSGINTLIALLALSAVYVYILTGSFCKRLGLFFLPFPLAIISNILRITSIIMVAYLFDVQTATGWYHDLSSPIFFIIGFVVLILVSWIIGCRINSDLLRNK